MTSVRGLSLLRMDKTIDDCDHDDRSVSETNAFLLGVSLSRPTHPLLLRMVIYSIRFAHRPTN